MKKILLAFLLTIIISIGNAQLLSWSPEFIQENSTPVDIILDANFGNKALLDYTPTTDVYVHIGVITSKSTTPSDWKYVKFTWGTSDPNARCGYLGNNKWKYTINGGIRAFFGITDASETIQKISILFRNGAGTIVHRNADGSDMYVPVYTSSLFARIDEPFKQPTYNLTTEPITKEVGEQLTVNMVASQSSTLTITLNGNQIGTGTGTSLTSTTTITKGGDQVIIAKAVNGGQTATDTLKFFIADVVIEEIPAGNIDGINYKGGDTSVVLVLYAPGKSNVMALGDFNNWTSSSLYLMKRTPDGNRFWIQLNGLKSGTEYAYQYVIDGSLQVADYYTEKVLDPWNDQFILPSTYPNLKPYPSNVGASGIVSIIQTGKAKYNWQVQNFSRPDKRNLVIYELLVRDFVAAHDWNTVKDSISYLKKLGVNAIELLPFNEFEGNISWGYNPSFYFAPDKYYGTETALKQFIDECHKNGIAVIMDIALNHSFYLSPMVQMYWDASKGKPAADNPWFNQADKHAYGVGYDMNHESEATKYFVERVIQHWLTNYKIDGFRWDLSKGFTQKQTCDANGQNCNVGSWGTYDASRIAIWKDYYNIMQASSSGSYCILEHLSDNPEEKELADYGMMPWGNLNYSYNQATMGYSNGWDFSWGLYTARGWTNPHLITYQESHDEERLMFKNLKDGNSSGTYTVRDTATALNRNKMAAAFWAMQPGPKMLWQFGEVGYDFSINQCENGTISENCRTNSKPIRWDYYNQSKRKALFETYEGLFKLRNEPDFLSTFTTGDISYNLSSGIKWLNVSDDALKIAVIGNFNVTQSTGVVNFPASGTWYSYLTDSITNISSSSVSVTLQPGEYYIFTNKDVRKTVLLPVNWLSFTANIFENNKVKLNWSTSIEINNDYYEIQRSVNGTEYVPIGRVAAGTSTGINYYEYNDLKPVKGINYYRIKQVDNDGKFSFSTIRLADIKDLIANMKIYPNPAVGQTSIFMSTAAKRLDILLTDMTGKTLLQKTMQGVEAGQQINLQLNAFTKGMYLLKLKTEWGTQTEKLLIQ